LEIKPVSSYTKSNQLSPIKKLMKLTVNIVSNTKMRSIYNSVKAFMELFRSIKENEMDKFLNCRYNECPPPSTSWITKWCEYTEKMALAYQMSIGTSGIYFKDKVKIIMSPDKSIAEFYKGDKNSPVTIKISSIETLDEIEIARIKVLELLSNLLSESSNGSGFENIPTLTETISNNFLHLKSYYKTEQGLLFVINNGSMQFNFYDHTKIILDSNSNETTITYISEKLNREIFYLHSERMFQLCSDENFVNRIEILLTFIEKLIQKEERRNKE